jgi:hypothetical protein
MKLACALAATITWMGCGIDTAAPGSGGSDPGSDPGTDPGTGPVPGDPGDGTGPITEASGRIMANTTWMGTVHVIGTVTIDPGVTLTVAPGTTVDVTTSQGFSITVSGVLDIQGTKASKVVFRSATAGEYWSDVKVPRGGVMTATYLVQTGGGLDLASTGKATLVDTQLSHVGGDLLMMSAGVLDMTYSSIGLETGRDTTHCNMHVAGGATIRASHSNISAASFGIMFYSGVNADFTYDNWFGNAADVVTQAGTLVNGDFSYSYFAKGNPSTTGTNAGLIVTNMATSRVADAGPR